MGRLGGWALGPYDGQCAGTEDCRSTPTHLPLTEPTLLPAPAMNGRAVSVTENQRPSLSGAGGKRSYARRANVWSRVSNPGGFEITRAVGNMRGRRAIHVLRIHWLDGCSAVSQLSSGPVGQPRTSLTPALPTGPTGLDLLLRRWLWGKGKQA